MVVRKYVPDSRLHGCHRQYSAKTQKFLFEVLLQFDLPVLEVLQLYSLPFLLTLSVELSSLGDYLCFVVFVLADF